MMRKSSICAGLALALITGCGGGGGSDWPPLFEPVPECQGATITPYAGDFNLVISHLAIGELEDGFDLDGDRDPDCEMGPPCTLPDNKLSAVGSLAQDAIDGSFEDFSLMIPMEFFDLPSAAPDTCVKFALYLGKYTADADMDGDDTVKPDGDCNDHDMAVNKNATEVVGDRYDNDCDGLADEDPNDNTPSTNTMDMDSDGFTLADGDCDDTNDMVHPGISEICGDGYDNDCDGVADRGTDGTTIVCNPYDLVNAPDESIPLDPLSFEGTQPVIAFTSGTITQGPNGLQLNAGPGQFSVAIPVTDSLTLDLRITGALIQADVVSDANGIYLTHGKLGGIIDAQTADKIMGLNVDEIGLTPDKTLLDATFANLLGPLLALPKATAHNIQDKYKGCRTPDIDVDGDGLEAFCDSTANGTMPLKSVDVCIDGDGKEYHDSAGMNCTEIVGDDGKPLFRDGISVEINFETVPAGPLVPPTAI